MSTQPTVPTVIKMPKISADNLERMRKMGDADDRCVIIKDAYLRMVSHAKYRPEAPSDGWGHILLSQEQVADTIRLEMEAWLASLRWHHEDEQLSFSVTGCPDYRCTATMYFALQAAQLCCSGPNPCIRRVLELALEALPDGDEQQAPP
jgi:hypothetical protein